MLRSSPNNRWLDKDNAVNRHFNETMARGLCVVANRAYTLNEALCGNDVDPIFRQERLGANQRPITVEKLRTIVQNDEGNDVFAHDYATAMRTSGLDETRMARHVLETDSYTGDNLMLFTGTNRIILASCKQSLEVQADSEPLVEKWQDTFVLPPSIVSRTSVIGRTFSVPFDQLPTADARRLIQSDIDAQQHQGFLRDIGTIRAYLGAMYAGLQDNGNLSKVADKERRRTQRSVGDLAAKLATTIFKA